jgi:hypothetical protein
VLQHVLGEAREGRGRHGALGLALVQIPPPSIFFWG